jgi:phytoene desaturase
MEFPLLFLGALPEKIPALYSLMNYASIKGGTWYPEGGIYSVVKAIYSLALELGVEFHFGQKVTEIIVEKNVARKVLSNIIAQENGSTACFDADVIIGGADYHHIESSLLPPGYRSYSDSYWEQRVMAPSCLIYYVGINRPIENLVHHSLFFDTSLDRHGAEIYDTRQWPSDPLFYVSAPSVTDGHVAPKGCENLFFLIPVASGLTNDSEEVRDKYFELILQRFQQHTGQDIKENIVFKKTFAPSDFISEYNAFKGNAYGLANTLSQTAIFKPSCRSKKVRNLFFTGQLTVPGPGVPPSLISGEVVAKEVLKHFGGMKQ